jgi:sugar phosphate permease
MTSTINNWFPVREKGTATGLYIASTQFAPIIVPPLVVLIEGQWGWRAVFFCLAIPGALMAIVWYLVVRNHPHESKHVNQAELDYINSTVVTAKAQVAEKPWMAGIDRIIRRRSLKPLSTNGEIMKSWNIWGDTLAYFFMNNVLYGMLTWIPSYLVAERGYDFIKMGFVASAPSVGGLIGALCGGLISDKVFNGRRKPTMLLTALFTAVMFVAVLTVPQNTALVVGSLVLTGFFLNVGWPMFTAYAMGLTTTNTYPFAISIINSGGNLGGFFAPIIVGMLLDHTGGNYTIAFSYFVVVLVIAFVLLLSLTEPRALAPTDAVVSVESDSGDQKAALRGTDTASDRANR